MSARKTRRRTSNRKPRKQESQNANALWENVKQIGIAVVLALIIKTSIIEAYKIPSASMEDTLLVGDFLLANKFIYGARIPVFGWRLPKIDEIERGDVVIFIYPVDGQTKYIKRCVGIPGDTITVVDKNLFVNGQRFPDSAYTKYDNYIEPRGPGGKSSPDNYGPYVVPPNNYFMMGDNRDNSADSRYWGTVPYPNVLGKALWIHWSWDSDVYPAPDVSIGDPLSVPRVFLHGALHFFDKVRWNRLFRTIH